MTGYTGVPSGAAMSMPLWKRKVPGPCRPSVSIVLRKRVRGSPKFARIGCCLSKGLIGQGYADTLALAISETPNKHRVTRQRRRTAKWDEPDAAEVSLSIGCERQ